MKRSTVAFSFLLLAACGPQEVAPLGARELIQQAHDIAGTGATDRAVTLLEQALALEDNHPSAWHRLGEMRLLSGLAGVHEALDKAASLGLDSASLHQTRGEAFEAEGKDREAALSFVQALEREPARKEAWYRLGEAQRRLGQDFDADQSRAEFERLKDAERRVVQLEAATAAQPNDPRLAAAAGTAYLDLFDIEGADAWVERALQIDSKCQEARFVAGRIAAARGQYQSAELYFEEFAKSQPDDPRPWMERANVAFEEGRIVDARLHAIEATKRADADPMVFLRQSHLLLACQDLEGALVACDNALMRDPSDPSISSLRDHILMQMAAGRDK